MYFKDDGVERQCMLRFYSSDISLNGCGGDNGRGGYAYNCTILLNALIPMRCRIDSNSAEYWCIGKGSYRSCGEISDSIIVEYDSSNSCFFGTFSFKAVRRIYPWVIYGDDKGDTVYDTVHISDGVFIFPPEKDSL
jgi:hypothetical protein